MNDKLKTFLTSMFLSVSLIVLSQTLDKKRTLEKYDFWSNQDWSWYQNSIPFLETPDNDIDLTYYYRWELVTMHLVYGSPEIGYASTEFIDRPWWSGAYGTISCPVGHQLYDFRWLKDARYFNDYAKFWFNNPGAQPQNYTNWLGDAVWQGYKVYKDDAYISSLLDGMINDYNKWEGLYWVEKEGMFAWDGMHDGMETNINSRQTENWFSGAPGYRPTFNAYMWAHAKAIVNIAKLNNNFHVINKYQKKADLIKNNFQSKCWDSNRNFFFHRFQNNEISPDKTDTIKANTLTYQSGKFKGSAHGRELMGYVPWYFNMIDNASEYNSAWKYLMKPDYFLAEFGPTVVERNDPQFSISKRCCVWSGNSWPFATSQTLKAMSNVINSYDNEYVNASDFFKLFKAFALTHRKNGKPYIAEAVHPDNGSWDGHDVPGHSEHYYHSSYIDLVISDLIGLKAQENDSIVVNPLTPNDWEYFILDDVSYHGHNISILWDRTGKKYNKGKGFRILAAGKTIAVADKVQHLSAYLPPLKVFTGESNFVNYAVNNTNEYYPKAIASFPGISHPIGKINDGQYWYLTSTTNQWSNEYSEAKTDWAGVDFGIEREIEKLVVYFVEDEKTIKAPQQYELEYWNGSSWETIPEQKRQFKTAMGRKGNAITFKKIMASKVRISLSPQINSAVGISEIEAWGYAIFPLAKSQKNVSNLQKIIKVRASYTSKFDEINTIVDGRIDVNGRWTAFESPNQSD